MNQRTHKAKPNNQQITTTASAFMHRVLVGDPEVEGVISPSWSVHAGAGSAGYSFIWAIAGKTQSYDDMGGFAITDMC